MKPVHTTLLASAFLVATYIAAPGSANAGGRDCMTPSSSQTFAAKKVNSDLDAALSVARTGRPVLKETAAVDTSVKTEGSTWIDFPNQCHIQDMLNHELDDLQVRANAFRVHEAELLQFEAQVVLGRYERAVAEITMAWKYGKIADDIAEKAIYEMRVEAFDYLESLGVVSIRERLQEAITVLIERGMNAEDRAIAKQELFVKLYTIRLEAALAVFEARGADGTATLEDLQRISQCLVALERLQKFSTPSDCGS